MSMNELKTKVDELRDLRRMADELAGAIGTIEDEIKAHMAALDTDELHGADFKITWKTVTSNRLDSKALKADAPRLYDQYCRPITTRRFCIA